jgi:hypothetical protein
MTADFDRQARRDALVIGVLTLLALAVPTRFGVPYSVGIVGALRILEGDLPYRDFWTMYAPGHFYLLAALFWMFGKKLLLASVAKTVLVAASGSVYFLIARQLGVTRQLAIVATGVFILILWKPAMGLSTYEPALLFILIGWLVLFRAGESLGVRAALTAGGSVGVAAWFKHDIAGYAALAMVLARVIGHAVGKRQRPWRETARSALLIGAGAAAVALPVAIWCWAIAGPDAWEEVVRFPIVDFPAAAQISKYPGLVPAIDLRTNARDFITATVAWFRFNVPLLLCVGWSVALLRRRPRRIALSEFAQAVLVATFAFFWLAAHVRPSTHITSMSMIALLLGGVAWSTGRSLLNGPIRLAATAVTLAYVACLLVEPAKGAVRIAGDWRTSRASTIPSLEGLVVPARDLEYYEPLAQIVQRSIPEGERIYVGLVRHDAIVASNAMVYAVVGRRGSSRYDELHAAVADRAQIQQEIINAMNEKRVRLVILWQFGWRNQVLDQIKAERRERLPETGADVLDRFLQQRFRGIGQFGEYQALWRETVPPPVVASLPFTPNN